MNRAFIWAVAREKSILFLFHDHFRHATNFWKLATLPYYGMWMTNELLPIIWILF